jgi:hypothetical protein
VKPSLSNTSFAMLSQRTTPKDKLNKMKKNIASPSFASLVHAKKNVLRKSRSKSIKKKATIIPAKKGKKK